MTDFSSSAQALAEQVMQQCDVLGSISQSSFVDRRFLSPQHKEANARVAQWMQLAGMRTWQDAVGNQWGRYESKHPNAKSLLFGSHLDTVPNGGKYDGMLGVVSPIALVQFFHQHNMAFDFHIDVVGFADEEGTRFGATLLGSKALNGEWQPQWAELLDENNTSMREAFTAFGLDIDKVGDSKLNPSSLHAYIELHIEQGPVLEQKDLAVGVVTAIAGARRFSIDVNGFAGHAGTVPMNMRQDALAGSAEMILAVEEIAKERKLVATVGRIENKPNGVNVISGNTTFSLDIRSESNTTRNAALADIWQAFDGITQKRKLSYAYTQTHNADAVTCNKQLQNQLLQACERCNIETSQLMSGAGHDAMAMVKLCPVAMLFTRCDKGISHHPAEAINTVDVAESLKVLHAFVQHFDPAFSRD